MKSLQSDQTDGGIKLEHLVAKGMRWRWLPNAVTKGALAQKGWPKLWWDLTEEFDVSHEKIVKIAVAA